MQVTKYGSFVAEAALIGGLGLLGGNLEVKWAFPKKYRGGA